jgi:uncharacterized protein YndB with AHSA1/START domain
MTPIDPAREFVTTRVFPHPPAAVYGAFADPVVLARWWGPAGFTNTFDAFELRPGGAWKFTMHAPDGGAYPNESEFVAVAPERVVFDHLGSHRFRTEMTFEPAGAGTRLTWRMTHATAEEADTVRAFVPAANEQNFDRLAAALAGPA